MEFKRARTDEQKNQRIDQIITVTEALFQKHDYADITLKMVADQLDYTRGNLYKYVSSKEVIFLMIFERHLHNWIEAVLHNFTSNLPLPHEEFADQWSKIMDKYQTMLEIDNLLSSIIETNVTFEQLIEFKSVIIHDFYRLLPIIRIQLPFLDEGGAKDFLYEQLMHASALYANVVAKKRQQKVLKICDPAYHFIEFYPTFREYIYIQINGLAITQEKTQN